MRVVKETGRVFKHDGKIFKYDGRVFQKFVRRLVVVQVGADHCFNDFNNILNWMSTLFMPVDLRQRQR